jgi:hypothetical protein
MRIGRTPAMFAADDRRGSPPALTEAQREHIGAVIRRRAAIRIEIAKLEAEAAALPTNAELIETFGVSVGSLYNAAKHKYRHEHPIDIAARAVPRETPTNNSGDIA